MLARFARTAGLVSVVLTAAGGQVAFRSQKLIAPPRAILRSPAAFRAVASVDSTAALRVRASADGVHWTEWQSAEPEDGAGALVFFGNLYDYLEVDSASQITLLFIDPGVTPAEPLRQARPRDGSAVPPIVTREQWGCTPETCPVQSPPVYTTVTHLIVHHTDGANDATDWAAVVRAIWVLHVQGNGWNDIGYNYLIDPNGVLYEGRAGGDGVLGAHFSCVNSGTMGVALLGTFSLVPPTGAALGTLRLMLAWQSSKWNLDPTGKQRHAASGLMLDTISGHRDANLSAAACGPTECPGNGAYTDLAEIRPQVGTLLAGACSIGVSERALCAPYEGGGIAVAVTAPAGCVWQAASAVDWVTVHDDKGTLELDVQANPGARRSGAVTLGGHTLTITQSASGERPLPCIGFNGIMSAASDSGRPVVAGSLISIYGSNLAPQQTSATSLASLPTALGGVSVSVNGRAAALAYVSPTQINAKLPPATNIGSSRMVVTANGIAGPDAPFSVTEATPAIFVFQGQRAIAQNDSDGGLNGPTAPVAPGGSVTIYVTGFSASLPVSATIGGRAAPVLSSGPVANNAGLYQVDLMVPQDAPPGDQLVIVTVSGAASTPALVTIGLSAPE